MRHWLFLSLVVLLTVRCVQTDVGGADVAADARPGEIAFRLAEPNDTAIIIPVTIDGKGPYDFVLDTGATLTCVGESLARELALQEPRGVLGRGATIGGSGNMRLVQIDSLRIGEIEATNVMACAVDLSNVRQLGLDVRGLLGLNVLKNFRVTLDFERKVMRLDPNTA
jgi:predicted aspartyl protease